MGIVRIRDGNGEETLVSRKWEGAVEIRVDDVEPPRIVFSEDSPFGASEAEVLEGAVIPAEDAAPSFPAWTLWVPTVLALVTVAAALVAPVLGAAPSERVVSGLAVVTYVASVFGVVTLYTDIEVLRDRGARWEPSARDYFGGGALAVVVALLAGGLVPPPSHLDVAYYAGVVIVAVFLAPVAAGPVYLWRRSRALGLDPP